MLDKYQSRENNIRMLSGLLGSQAELNRRLGKPPRDAYLSTIAGANPSRQCGSQLAAKIEKVFNLPPGWMSVPHTEEEAREALQTVHRVQKAISQQVSLNPTAPLFDRPVSQLIATADTCHGVNIGDVVFYDTATANDRRPGLYVIEATGVLIVARLSVGLSGAVFSVGTESAPAETVQAVGRVVGILRRFP